MVLTFVVLSGKKAPAKLIARDAPSCESLSPITEAEAKLSKSQCFDRLLLSYR